MTWNLFIFNINFREYRKPCYPVFSSASCCWRSCCRSCRSGPDSRNYTERRRKDRMSKTTDADPCRHKYKHIKVNILSISVDSKETHQVWLERVVVVLGELEAWWWGLQQDGLKMEEGLHLPQLVLLGLGREQLWQLWQLRKQKQRGTVSSIYNIMHNYIGL